jgi:predicted outer membrane protein
VSVLVAVTIAGCTSATTTPKNVQASGPTPGISASTLSAGDRAWLAQAHQTNMAEIAAGNMAKQKGSASVRQLGARLVADHMRLDQALQATAISQGVEVPSALTSQQTALAAQYAQASGSAFDRLFVTTQATAHAQAMQATQAEIAQGSDSTVVAAARAAEPVIEAHMSLLQEAAQTLHVPLPSMS